MSTLLPFIALIVLPLVAIVLYELIKYFLLKDAPEIVENYIYRVGITNYATATAALFRVKGYQNRLKIEPEITMINTIDDTKTKITVAQLEMYALKESKDEETNPWRYYES